MKKKHRDIVTPGVESDFAQEGKKTFWKQVLPQAPIHYTTKAGKRSTIDFNETYLSNIISAFNSKALDQTPFLLADADNRHTMDPERFRGEVTEMRLAYPGEKPGLYAKIKFPTPEAAKAVVENPSLGVSARIREGIATSDGRTFQAGIIHVLGTLDPQVTGMSGWQPVDLSNVLDLSNETFSERETMAKNGKSKFAGVDINSVTEEDIDNMTDEEVEAFLAEVAPDFIEEFASDEDDDEDEDEDEEEEVDENQLVGAGASLSNRKARKDIELANAQAQAATSRANEALRRMAEAEFRTYRSEMLAEGVPPHLLDLAEPVLNRADDMVIDLSATEDDDINVSEIVRGLLDASKGLVDLSAEQGHYRSEATTDGTDPDADMLASWEAQFGGSANRSKK